MDSVVTCDANTTFSFISLSKAILQGVKNLYVDFAIRLPTDTTVYFVKNLCPLFTLHVSGSHKPVIRGISSCFLYTTIWFKWCLCCSSACACGLVCRDGFTVQWAYESPKHVG